MTWWGLHVTAHCICCSLWHKCCQTEICLIEVTGFHLSRSMNIVISYLRLQSSLMLCFFWSRPWNLGVTLSFLCKSLSSWKRKSMHASFMLSCFISYLYNIGCCMSFKGCFRKQCIGGFPGTCLSFNHCKCGHNFLSLTLLLRGN